MTRLIHRLAQVFVFLAIAALTLLTGCDLSEGPSHRGRDAAIATGQAPAAYRNETPQFAPGQLERHFLKHGGEMGFKNQEDYLRAAQAIVAGGPGIEIWHRDGDTLFYKASTNEFAVLSNRNVIRTYFRPDDGPRYWERQKLR
ncbi:MAG: hypothetical protein QM820_05575 [Minicystis sp.]